MKEELRMYSFCNFYLSSIQQGIQTGHMSDNMTCKYLGYVEHKDRNEAKVWFEWITAHKTYIVLNGGDDESVNKIYLSLDILAEILDLPFTCFMEPGLGDIMTCCGVVVPARYFNARREVYEDGSISYCSEIDNMMYIFKQDSAEYKFIELVKSKPLAR